MENITNITLLTKVILVHEEIPEWWRRNAERTATNFNLQHERVYQMSHPILTRFANLFTLYIIDGRLLYIRYMRVLYISDTVLPAE